MSALTWRTIRRGEKWRDKTGRFYILRRSMDGSHVYVVYQPRDSYFESIMDLMLMRWSGAFPSLDEAKAAAEARA